MPEPKEDVKDQTPESSPEENIEDTDTLNDGDQQVDTDTEQPKDEESEEKNIPFNQHPRFREIIQEKNELKKRLEQLQEQLQGGQSLDGTQAPNLSPETQRLIDQIKSSVKEDLMREAQEQQELEAKVEKEVDQMITTIKQKVGSEDLYEKSFKPFVASFFEKFPTVELNQKTLDTLYEDWKSKPRSMEGGSLDSTSPAGGKSGPVIRKDMSLQEIAEEQLRGGA